MRLSAVSRVLGPVVAVTLAAAGFGATADRATHVEIELDAVWEAPGTRRAAVVTAFELGATVPLWGGGFYAELEGGQRSEGGPPHGPGDFLFTRNLLLEASPLKVGRTAWTRAWSPGWSTVVGRFAPESFLDKLALASSKTHGFLARPFVRPTAVADPGTGLGALVRRDFTGGLRFAAFLNDAHGTARLSPAHTLAGEWFRALEAQWPAGPRGLTRVLPWQTSRDGRRAHGVSVSHEDRWSPRLGWFVRAGLDHGGLARTSRVAAAGLGWNHNPDTRVAVAGAAGLGGDDRQETIGEAYIRRLVAPGLALSLHVQTSRRSSPAAARHRETQVLLRAVWTAEGKPGR